MFYKLILAVTTTLSLTAILWANSIPMAMPDTTPIRYNHEHTRIIAFISQKNPELIRCIPQLMKHKRAIEAIAISGIETGFGTKGNALTYNNIGNIKSRRADRTWRIYNDMCEGLEDIADLIEREDYADATIDEMNGHYCVDESRKDNKCEGWTETIMIFINEMI